MNKTFVFKLKDEQGNSVDHRIRYESLPASAVDFAVELDERYGTRLAARLSSMYPTAGEAAA